MLLPVLAPEGEPGLDSLVNFRPGSGESRAATAKRTDNQLDQAIMATLGEISW